MHNHSQKALKQFGRLLLAWTVMALGWGLGAILAEYAVSIWILMPLFVSTFRLFFWICISIFLPQQHYTTFPKITRTTHTSLQNPFYTYYIPLGK